MKRMAAALAAALLAVLVSSAMPAIAAEAGFGLKDVGQTFTTADGSAVVQAGSHPFETTNTLDVNTTGTGGKEIPIGATKDLRVELPPGFTGDPFAVEPCSGANFLEIKGAETACPNSSAVGTVVAKTGTTGPNIEEFPLYSLEPPPGVAARIGFVVTGGVPFSIDLGVKSTAPYNLVALPTDIPQPIRFYGAKLTVWGNPASAAHNPLRGHCVGLDGSSLGTCRAEIANRPFLVMPRSCTGPLETSFELDSWQNPGAWLGPYLASSPGMSGCAKLGFSPTISAQPTSHGAESASGLDFGLDVKDEELANPEGAADSDLKKAVVTLPPGVTINPSQAEGLGVCTERQLEGETAFSGPGEGCPQSSKIGTVEVETPLLEGEILKGALFVAAPYTNRFGTLIALYMTVKDPKLGIGLVLAGKVEPDPQTGQLVSTFDEVPQQPFSHFRLHFREGGRSPLVTPPLCGNYTTVAELYPWANPGHPIEKTSTFEIDQGSGGGSCPAAGTPPFHPGFQAGTLDNGAGRYSPFYMQLTRQDGDQDMTKFSSILPPGVTGKIAGVSKCPQGAVETAKTRTGPMGGEEELAHPSCPSTSLIGHILSGAGVGPELTYVPGSLYLGGPYHGDPLSVVAIVPAVAGPFDAGTVVVQEALTVNSRTAEVEVDGAASDPIPHILKGIPLKVRDIRISTDRPQFTLNPTSCEAEATRATLWGGGSNVFSPNDDIPFGLRAPFQAANCAALPFKPRVSLELKGGTRRGTFPALRLTYLPRPGREANLERFALRFPHSEFIEQGHFRTICTRVQFAAGEGFGSQCPAGSVYGHVTATTPILDEPLEGPVFLRSSSHNLPDVVLALHGPPSAPINLEVPTRIDSVHGGLRAIASETPDAPITRVSIRMQGGQKGLFVNSTNICRGKHLASVHLTAHNGRMAALRPPLRAPNCAKAHKRKHKRHHR
jgi:hypothetical protein